MRKKSTSQSIAGALLAGYGIYGLGAALAATLYVSGLGTSVLPGWVGYAAIPCVSTAVVVAYRTRDLRGILIGVLVFLPAVYVLGLSEAGVLNAGNSVETSDGIDIVSKVKQLLSVLIPLTAFGVAILLPLAAPLGDKARRIDS